MTLHARAAQKAIDRAIDATRPTGEAGSTRDGGPTGEAGSTLCRPSVGDAALAKAATDVAALRDLTAYALADLRALIFELRPDAVAEHGLVEALVRQTGALSVRNDVPIIVTGPPGRLALTARAEETAYRIALEAVHNAVKHAGAGEITVDVADADDAIVVTVRDDGRGFDPVPERAGHLGLTSMRERAAAIGAELVLSATPDGGTTVRVTVPVSRPSATP